MSLSDCIPKDKFDTEAVARAAALGFPAINPILPDLLVWMQDLNWPVALDLAPLLATAGREIAPLIKTVFAGDDFIWSYALIAGLLPDVNDEVWALLRDDLRVLAMQPTPEQKREELNDIAAEILAARGA